MTPLLKQFEVFSKIAFFTLTFGIFIFWIPSCGNSYNPDPIFSNYNQDQFISDHQNLIVEINDDAEDQENALGMLLQAYQQYSDPVNQNESAAERVQTEFIDPPKDGSGLTCTFCHQPISDSNFVIEDGEDFFNSN